ncbi:uncharacterized protein BXZ73DRAFT_51996, partial [Epithele typhae]|uniref:uncharacterized protein n=1 Tax=Epithele typhae TaxID=378194 RepID=UPI0020089D0E
GGAPELPLPCRETEYGRVLKAVEKLFEDGSGGCICEFLLVSCGVRRLRARQTFLEVNPFLYIEINSLNIPERTF